MKITSQEEYGLRCLLRLAEAGSRSLTIPEIAASEGLSAPYVAKLLAVLRQAGLIDSVRGCLGGYRLARSAVEITIGEVLAALGEPLFDEPGYCSRHAGTETEGACVRHGQCNLKDLWQSLETWMHRALAQITLADALHQGMGLGERVRARLAEAVAVESASSRIPLTTLQGN